MNSKEAILAIVDHNLRSENSLTGRALKAVSNKHGKEYLSSIQKRVFDLAIAMPAFLAACPIIGILAIAKKIEDGGSMFFVQDRVQSTKVGSELKLWKIRCMKENTDAGSDNRLFASGKKAWEDPRNTKLGAFMRRYQLEEFPQLLQVVMGDLSLFGIRPDPEYCITERSNTMSPSKFNEWFKAYNTGFLGVSGLNQTFGSTTKDGESANYDIFYSKHASLGLDMYLIWRTALRLTHLY